MTTMREMKDTIWLTCNPNGVVKMTKSQPRTAAGSIAVKVLVTVDGNAFQPPALEREIKVADWRDGVDFADVDLKVATITEQEAELIRKQRLAKMRDILESQGFLVTPLEDGAPEV
jgi:hypothetical protein